jgi:restriction system protein
MKSQIHPKASKYRASHLKKQRKRLGERSIATSGRSRLMTFRSSVAALLRGMGYHVSYTAPPGPDRGIDIVAHADPLGLQAPRIKVQVKRRADKITVEEIRSFLATLGESDAGIFVSTGGFTSEAEREARGQERRKIMLVDARRLLDLWIEYYHQISDEQRRLMPLKPIYHLDLEG